MGVGISQGTLNVEEGVTTKGVVFRCHCDRIEDLLREDLDNKVGARDRREPYRAISRW